MSVSSEAIAPRSDVAVIALVGFAHAVSHFFHLVIPLHFPWLMPEFGLNYTQAGALMTLFFVVSGFGQALAGLVVDRVGSKPVLFSGIALLALSGVLLGVAQNYAMLMLAAAVAGAGNCVFHPADYTILNRRVSKPRLGHAFSVHGLSGNLGWAAAPVFMIWLATVANWRLAAFAAGGLALLSLALFLLLRGVLDDAEEPPKGTAGQAVATPAVSTLAVLRAPAVLLCFTFFFLATVAFGAIQNFSPAVLQAMYGLSLASAATGLSAYLLGGALGTALGGFLTHRAAQERTIALCISGGACISLALASGLIPAWGAVPLMALMGGSIGIAAPSRDLLIRQAATRGLGDASFGRVYGFVYSGLDAGLATAPLIFGPIMDGAHFPVLWLGVAVFQGLAVFSALRVGRLNFS